MFEELKLILREWQIESGCLDLQFSYVFSTNELKIYTTRAGYMIGKGGVIVAKYSDKINKVMFREVIINFIETDMIV